MGGEGTIRYAAQHPERFAAVVPAAGSAVFVPDDARRLADLSVWMFQGETDNISTAELAKRMIDAIRAAGGDPLYTEYPETGHGILNLVYREPALVDWMLEQRRQ